MHSDPRVFRLAAEACCKLGLDGDAVLAELAGIQAGLSNRELERGRILSMRYEDVVEDLEGTTRRMLAFLDLPFEADCLDFHLSTDAVATASSEQVRRPLNREGIGNAEPYRRWLGQLIEVLGPLGEA